MSNKKKLSSEQPVRIRRRPQPDVLSNIPMAPITETSVGGNASSECNFEPMINWSSVGDVRPNTRNARTHTKEQIRKIAASIEQFGFTNPVLIDGTRRVVAGHGRLEAAKLLGISRIPTIRLDHLSDAQIRTYVIADNRLAELAGWDEDLLALELQGLSELELDFDLEITGFETAEIDLLIESLDSENETEAEDEPLAVDFAAPAISRLGDLWLLGDHRLLCADARDPASFERLLKGRHARMVMTDPPYNVRVDGHVCGLGKVKHREFAMASGEMTEAEFVAFLKTVLGHLAGASVDGALLYVFMDWRHLFELLSAGREVGLSLENLCVWNKTNGGMGSLYRSKHELVPIFKFGRSSHCNNVALGKFGRYRSNVWDYAGVNTFRRGRGEDLSVHPTVKPTALVADAIKDCTRRGDIVLDAFLGSGTTLIAAEKTGRLGYGLEIDPHYVDTAISRWEKMTSKKAVHADTGLSLDALQQQRAASAPRRADDGNRGALRKEAPDVD